MNTAAIRQPTTIANAVNISLVGHVRKASTTRTFETAFPAFERLVCTEENADFGGEYSSFYQTNRQELQRLRSVA